MATSGSFSGTNPGGQDPYIFWERIGYSITNNTSTVKITFKVKRTSSSYSTMKYDAYYSIRGGKSSSSYTYVEGSKDYKLSSVSVGNYVTIGSYTKTIQHNSDGTGTLYARGYLNLSGTTAGILTVSGTATLNTLPRKSSISASSTSVNTGNSVTLNIGRKASAFRHVITASLAGKTYTLLSTSSTATSVSWIPTAEMLPNDISSTATITCKTYTGDGGSLVGSNTCSIKVTVPNYTITPNIALEYIDRKTIGGVVYNLAGITKIKINHSVVYSPTKQAGANLSYFTGVRIPGTNTYKKPQSSDGLYAFPTGGTYEAYVRISDSRGRTGEGFTSFIFTNYNTPRATISLQKLSDTSFDITGGYAVSAITGNFSKVIIRCINIGNGAEVGKQEFTDTINYTGSVKKTFTGLSADNSYKFEVIVSDAVTTSTPATKATGINTLSLYKGGKGVTLFGDAVCEGFVVNGNSQFNGAINGYSITSDWHIGTTGGIPVVRPGDGVMEVGSMIDMNPRNATADDSGVRLTANAKKLDINQIGKLYLDSTEYLYNIVDTGNNFFAPSTNGTVRLGGANHRWANFYAVAANFSGNVTINGELSVPSVRIRCQASYDTTTTYAANLYVGSSGIYSRYKAASSSRTIKHDIKLLDKADIKAENLYDLDIYQFKYNADELSSEDQRYLCDLPGFIIEDMERVYPVAVDKPSDDVKEWGWNSYYLIPPMLKLIQNQKKQLDEQQLEINEIKLELEQIKAKQNEIA